MVDVVAADLCETVLHFLFNHALLLMHQVREELVSYVPILIVLTHSVPGLRAYFDGR